MYLYINNTIMGDHLYIDLWKKYSKIIILMIKKGGGNIPLSPLEFKQRGNRTVSGYSFRLQISKGVISSHRGSAVARDLKTVLDGNDDFKKYAIDIDKDIIIRLTNKFELQIIITEQQ